MVFALRTNYQPPTALSCIYLGIGTIHLLLLFFCVSLPLPVIRHIEIPGSRRPSFINLHEHRPDQADRRLLVGKDPDHPLPAADLFIEPLNRVLKTGFQPFHRLWRPVRIGLPRFPEPPPGRFQSLTRRRSASQCGQHTACPRRPHHYPCLSSMRSYGLALSCSVT